jgi:excisionase family DNA binding protein
MTTYATRPALNPPAPEWLSLQQAAVIYAVSVDTLRRRIRAGKLPASRFGVRLIRVRIEDLDREVVPSSVELRWRPDDHQAAFTFSS